MKDEKKPEAIQKKLDEIQEMLDEWKKEKSVPEVTYIPVEIQDYSWNHNAYDPCEFCSNNPKNNPYATGICHCALPALSGPFRITC